MDLTVGPSLRGVLRLVRPARHLSRKVERRIPLSRALFSWYTHGAPRPHSTCYSSLSLVALAPWSWSAVNLCLIARHRLSDPVSFVGSVFLETLLESCLGSRHISAPASQVEVLFVLCTLLGARRKGEAHQALANLGLIDVLDSMFDRLSWGVPASTQGPHGAHCDCNPESALRVQYLRLVHNFLDR